MEIRLKRYYGDGAVTKSVMEVWMDGEGMPRMVCEAREGAYRDYRETFAGVSEFCLPAGRWRMKVGRSPYGVMGLRVPRCPGHRQVFVGHRWSRQMWAGEVLIGEAVMPREWNVEEWGDDAVARERWERKVRRIENGEEVFGRLTVLVYEAFGRGEEVWMVVENEGMECVDGGE